MHGSLESVNALDIVHGFVFVLVEDRSDVGIGGSFRVPFQYQGLGFLDAEVYAGFREAHPRSGGSRGR